MTINMSKFANKVSSASLTVIEDAPSDELVFFSISLIAHRCLPPATF